MNSTPALNEIKIRTTLEPGDLGDVVQLHGRMYAREYGYGVMFEAYVAEGLAEFARQYQQGRGNAWVCEHDAKMVAFLVMMDRGESAQLRYFLVLPEYRGIGLGKYLMEAYMKALRQRGYRRCYLLTTHEQESAAHLYRKHGFILVEEHDSDLFGKPLKEQRYELNP